MKKQIKQAQEDIIKITKKQKGFIQPPAKELDLGIDWV